MLRSTFSERFSLGFHAHDVTNDAPTAVVRREPLFQFAFDAALFAFTYATPPFVFVPLFDRLRPRSPVPRSACFSTNDVFLLFVSYVLVSLFIVVPQHFDFPIYPVVYLFWLGVNAFRPSYLSQCFHTLDFPIYRGVNAFRYFIYLSVSHTLTFLFITLVYRF